MESDNDDDITLCALAKKIQEQNTLNDEDDDEEDDNDEDIPLIHIVHKKNSNNIDNVPLINIKSKIKCSDIVNKGIEENTSKDSVSRTDNYDRTSKREGDQKKITKSR